MARYSQLGQFTLVPAADLASATARINVHGDARLGGTGAGKQPGMLVAVQGTNTITLYIALGAAPTDKWCPVDGGTAVTPA